MKENRRQLYPLKKPVSFFWCWVLRLFVLRTDEMAKVIANQHHIGYLESKAASATHSLLANPDRKSVV